ncbi:MAG: hypothetical protein L6406_02990 [Desulfobacterales bacterium]|nr:hypothetical protein [Desulfobacterales bacterium]
MKGKDIRLSVTDTERCVDCQGCMFACARRQGVAGLAKIFIGVRSIGGMERGFVVIVCRACDDPPWDDEINKPMICAHCGYCATPIEPKSFVNQALIKSHHRRNIKGEPEILKL